MCYLCHHVYSKKPITLVHVLQDIQETLDPKEQKDDLKDDSKDDLKERPRSHTDTPHLVSAKITAER